MKWFPAEDDCIGRPPTSYASLSLAWNDVWPRSKQSTLVFWHFYDDHIVTVCSNCWKQWVVSWFNDLMETCEFLRIHRPTQFTKAHQSETTAYWMVKCMCACSVWIKPKIISQKKITSKETIRGLVPKLKMCPAIFSGIVGRDTPVSYWPIFSLSLITVQGVFATVNCT